MGVSTQFPLAAVLSSKGLCPARPVCVSNPGPGGAPWSHLPVGGRFPFCVHVLDHAGVSDLGGQPLEGFPMLLASWKRLILPFVSVQLCFPRAGSL